MRFLIISLFVFGVGCQPANSQIDVYNGGTLISIQQGSVVAVYGSYVDNSGSGSFGSDPNSALPLDAPIFLSGELIIHGNIQNNNTVTNTNLIYEFESASHTGKVVLAGTSDQTIGGLVTSYFPNLELNKSAGSLILQRNIAVDNNLTLTSGSVNLNGQTLTLSQNGNIVGETAPNRIISGYPGQLETTTFQLSSANANYSGIGLGYPVLPTNFVATKFYRLHGPGNSTDPGGYTVADGSNILRVYKMETTTLTGTFPQLTFYYHDSELNGIPENNLVLYVSNDGGTTWVKHSASSDVNTTANIVTATNVPVVAGSGNIFVLAANDCLAGNKPNVTISSTSAAITAGNMNICDQTLFEIEVPMVGTNSYQWTTPLGGGNGYKYTAPAPSLISLTNDGAYSVFVRNQRGCENASTLMVDVRAIPSPSFSILPNPNTTSLCFNEPLAFDDTSTASDGSAITGWAWNFGDANSTTSAIKSPAFTYPSEGPQIPALIVTSEYQCVSSQASRPINIETLPDPQFDITNGVISIDEICEDINVTFLNQSTYVDYAGNSGTLTYEWMFGDGNTSANEHPVHSFLVHGDYSITLKATAPTQCSAELTNLIPFQVNPEPIPSFIPRVNGNSISEVCEGIDIFFDNQSAMPDATGMTFNWDFDDGTASSTSNPVKQFGSANVFDVTLTATSTVFGCTESQVVPVTVHPSPTGYITVVDPDICLDEEAVFTINSSILYGTMTYDWNFADGSGSISPVTMIAHTYVQPRLYQVALTRTSDKGCVNTVYGSITVHPSPIAGFHQVNVCDGKEARFYNNSVIQAGVIESFNWNFGDNTSSVVRDPLHLFPMYGDYSVTLKAVSNFGCENEVTHPVTIYRNPSFNLGASVAGCSDVTVLNPAVDLNAYLPNGSTFSWFNSSGQSLANTPQLQITEQEIYSITIKTPSPEFCESTIAIPVFVFKRAVLGADVATCSQLVLDAENGLPGEKIKADNTLYIWRKNGVQISTQQSITVTETSDYEITLTRLKAGTSCSSSDVIHVDVELPVTVTLPAQIIRCEGDLLELDAGVTAQSYTWTNLNTGAVIGTQKTQVATNSATYKVNVSNGACSATTVTEVIFSPLPTVSFGTASLVYCTGESISLTDYSFTRVSSMVSNEWNLGDNSVLNNQSQVAKSYNTPGDYSITLSASTLEGCNNTFTQVVSIQATPVTDFDVTDACAKETILIQNNSSSADVTFDWDFDDATESNLPNPIKSFDEDGVHTISLSVTSSINGCVGNLDKTVMVHPIPEVDFGNQITTCGTSLLLNAFNAGSGYNWFDPANGNASLSSSQQYLATTDGPIGLEVTNSFGCKNSDVATVALNTAIVVNLGPDRAVCDVEILDAGYFPGAQYAWLNGNTTRTFEANTSGVYSVTVTDQNACVASSSVELEIHETPVLQLEDVQSFCDNTTLLLNADSGSGYTYLWSTGATSPSIQVITSGNYDVTVTNFQCSSSKSVEVTEHPTPVAKFSTQNVCSGNSIAFDNQTQWPGSGALTYLWDFADGTLSSQADVTKIYNTLGTYSVTLKARSDKGCEGQVIKDAIVHPIPVASFSVRKACSGIELALTNTTSFSGSDGLTYQWDFGNGQSSSASVPVYSYPSPGNYLINVVVNSSEGCSDSYLQSVTVGQTPSAINWLNEIETCNASVTLDAGNPGSTYTWSDNTINQSLQVFQAGMYQVSVESQDGCSADLEANVVFNNSIQPILAPNTDGCGSVVLDPSVVAVTYLWSTGAQSKTLKVFISDQYSVQVINEDLCVGNATTLVQINEIPIFELGDNKNACEGESLEISADIEIPAEYSWSTGSISNEINVTQTGNYSLVATTASGCTHKDNLDIVFHVLPVLDFDPAITACGNLALDAKNNGSSYKWSTGSTQQVLNVTQSGIYQLEVVNGNNCSNKDAIDVTILALPTLDLGGDIVLCNGKTELLDAGISGNQYVWSDNSTSRYLTVGSAGDYRATVTNSLGCSATDLVNVTVRAPLGLELGNDRLLCSNEGVYLDAVITNANYTWGSDTGFSSNQKTILTTRPGRYWVSVMDVYSCVASDSIQVTATTQNITANFLIPSVVDKGDVVQFAQLTEPEPVTFYWEFGDGQTSRDKNPTHRYFITGEFSPTLVVSNGICADTLRKSIVIRNARTQAEPTPVLPTLIEIVSAHLYPNPSTGLVKVNVLLTTAADVGVSIFSLDGHKLEGQQKWLLEDEFEFDMANVSEGIYLLQVMVGSRVKVFKLVKIGQ